MLVQKIYYTILVSTFIMGVVRKKRLTTPFKILTYTLGITVLLEATAELFTFLYRNNVLIYHIMSIGGYIFYSIIYYGLFKSKSLRKVTLISIILVAIFFLLNILFIQKPAQGIFPTYIYLVTNALLVVWSLLLFKQMLQYSLSIKIIRQSIFWFNTAILFFSSTMSLSMEMLNYYAKHHWGYDIVYYLWEGEFCLFYILIGISLLLDNKEKSSKIWAPTT